MQGSPRGFLLHFHKCSLITVASTPFLSRERLSRKVTLSPGDGVEVSRISWLSPPFARKQANDVCGVPAREQPHTSEVPFQDFPVLVCTLTGGFERGTAEDGEELALDTSSSGFTSALDVVPLDPLSSTACAEEGIVLP
jgi:hypothetical protein